MRDGARYGRARMTAARSAPAPGQDVRHDGARREPTFEAGGRADEDIASIEPRTIEADYIRQSSGTRVATPPQPPKAGKRIDKERQPSLLDRDLDYELPRLTFLAEPKKSLLPLVSEDALEQNAGLLEGVLEDFGVKGEIIDVRPGPVVTLYEFEPAPGMKSSRVIRSPTTSPAP